MSKSFHITDVADIYHEELSKGTMSECFTDLYVSAQTCNREGKVIIPN